LEQIEDLLFVEAGIRVGLKRLAEPEALSADGGGPSGSGLGALELVIVGAQEEVSGGGLDTEPLLLTHQGVWA